MIIKRENIRAVHIWRAPADGEIVPDYPPLDITDAVTGIEIVRADDRPECPDVI